MKLRFALVLATCVSIAHSAFAASSTLVISQIYGGGGNAGATLKNDFIEIFNRGTTTINLTGWSVQYASSAGTTWQATNLSGSLAPGKYYLIQEAAGAGGTVNLPTPDATGTINMSATAGKVALVNSTTVLTGSCPAAVDFIGYDGANCFEGTATVVLSNTTAALRNGAGCTDTDNNAADFTIGSPAPRNSATAANPCTVTNNPPVINAPANPITSVLQNAAPFNVSLTGSDDNNAFTWGATAGTGVSSVVVNSGQGTSSISYTVTLVNNYTGTATFTASLSDGVNAAVTQAVNITVNAVVINNPPTITPPANPITTVEQSAPPFTVALNGNDDNSIYNWSAIAGTGVSLVSVTAGQGTNHATFTVTLQGGFSGTATFTASLSDNVNASATQAVNITVTPPPPPPNHIVISQVYGGGGNSLATYQNDYVELYNPTGSSVLVSGWTLQYQAAGSTGTWSGSQPLGGTIGPGEYFLVSLASGGANGSPLPPANIVGGPASINMSATAGKIALVSNADPLSNCPFGLDADLVDLVGYGTTANCREGSSNAPAGSNTTALFRKNSGATDTDVNGSDFVTGTPNPRRTAPIVEIGPFVVLVDPNISASTAPHDASITITFSEPVNVAGNWFDITCPSGTHNSATTANTDGGATWVITPNVSFNPGELCTVTLFAANITDQDTDDSAPNTDTLQPSNKVWSFTVAINATPPPYGPEVHLTMGNPSNAVADINFPNNYLMMKPTYALSYNRDKGTPNWVSWHLTNEWYGTLSRVDTFRPDPLVPPSWYRVQAFDYFTTGFDRGHMTPNADRDNENRIPINQETYLMSNMVPQAPDNNQGPWAQLEGYLRTLADAGNELYIVSGPAGVGGTGSNGGTTTTLANGHVTVPASTWKVALVLPKLDGNDVARVTAATCTIAVIMPNTQGIRNTDWHTFLTTVDAVEALSGYDLFSNVPAAIQNAIEAGLNCANPPGTANQSFSTNEDVAKSFTLDVASPNNASLTYTITSTPTHGALSGSDGSRTYTPAPDFNGNDSFTYTVSDGTHTSNTATVSITVLEVNDPPTANDDAKSTDEDTTLTFPASDLTANDSTGPANESAQTLTVTSVTATANTHGSVVLSSGTVTYSPDPDYNGPASFSYHVCDNGITAGLSDPRCADATVNVTVNPVNDPPTAANDAKSTDEDIPLNFLASDLTANDSAGPANESAQTLTVTSVTATANTHGSVSLASGQVSYAPAANYNGPASFTYQVCDNGVSGGLSDPQCATATVNVTVNAVNDPPTATVSAPSSSPEGAAVTASANVSDPDDASFTYAWSVTKNGSPYANGSGASITFTPDDNGSYLISVIVTDGSGATGSASATTTVTNVAPAITSATLSSASIDENGSATISGTFTDPGSDDTHTVIVNWGDGTATLSLPKGSRAFSLTYQYLDDAPSGTASDVYAISITVADDDGGAATAGASITVNNVAPVLGSVSGPVNPAQLGSSVSISAGYTDVGTLDTHTAVFTWDDGSSSPGTCAAGTCTASHTYAAAGVYEVTMTVTDDDTGSASSKFDYVVVFDPAGGFVTGGGWINSPVGAYIANPALTGKATFGFVSKYQRGQSTPTGNTEFQFHAAGFNFHSTVYDWLVIAGARAQYKGTGTVNGSGNYGFLLTAVDGDVNGGGGVDKFRIKIWDKTSGGMVYDNVAGASDDIDSANPQQLGGGSIVISSSR